jgi:hypothetical protein
VTGYTRTRPRGLAPWQPRLRTLALLEQVRQVLGEYEEFLPLTLRQVYYRLVAAHGYPKTESAYERLCEALNRARRAELVSFDAIRDDGGVASLPNGLHGLTEFWAAVRAAAEQYALDRLDGQALRLEVWCEAAGMVPQLERVAHPYGVPVFSSGGFDSLAMKYEAATRFIERSDLTLVLHIGDLDPSGRSIFDAAAEDVGALAADLGHPEAVEFSRVAVTREQVSRYGLPEAPPKRTDRRGQWVGGTVQAEALEPADLARELNLAIESELDLEVYERVLERERRERNDLLRQLQKVR